MAGRRTDPLYDQGVAHLLGDYVIQSDWMAAEKVTASLPAAAHAVSYAAAFVPLTRSWRALAVIGGTHFAIDRWRLARHVVWAKNQAAPARYRYPRSHARATGYHPPDCPPGADPTSCSPGKPDWMAVWLMIVADNTLHLLLNRWALQRWG